MDAVVPSSSKSNKSRERYLEALNLLVTDQEEKYDECLVDGLFKFISEGSSISLSAAEVIKKWYEDEELVNARHARLFKLQDHYCQFINLHISPSKFDLISIAECFWSRIPAVIARDNSSEISAALSLLRTLLVEEPTFRWLIEKQFTDYFIVDVATLAKYYLEANKNYHIQNQARQLFVALIRSTCRIPTPNQHRIVLSTKQSIEQMLESGSQAIYYVLFDCLSRRISTRATLDIYDLKNLFWKLFDKALEQKKFREINNLCKCMALSSIFSKTLIEKLKSTGNLEAIITYVTNLYDNIFHHTTMRYYVIYPLLVHCDSEDARVLSSQLMMTRDNGYFIERFIEDKILMQCIMYLKQSVSKGILDLTAVVATRNHRRYFTQFLQVVFEYIRCNYKSRKAYKNVLECCEVLSSAIDAIMLKKTIVWLFQLIVDICELIETNDDSISGGDKAIFLQMIKILAQSQHKTTIFDSDKFTAKMHKNYMRYIRIAAKFSDLDTLNEFAELFLNCNFNFQQCPEDNRLYVELIWNHMFTEAKANAFHDLYGNVVSLFCYIDIHCDEKLLTEMEIQKHHTIPRQLGEILANFSTDYTTIESIFKSLSCQYTEDRRGINYLLFILKSSKSFSEDLEYMIEGICIALKRELEEFASLLMMISIFGLVEELLKTNSNSLDTLKRLIKTRILETLHYVHESSLYSRETRIHVCRKIHKLKSDLPQRIIFKSQQQASDAFVKLAEELDPEDVTRHKRASQMAKFYYTKDQSCCPSSPYKFSDVDMNSFVDTILDQKTSARGVLECY